MSTLGAYIPIDRRHALLSGQALPDRPHGVALFADISGFTALTAALAGELGAQRGAEELTNRLAQIYGALIVEVQRYGGSVVGFSGDAITCWFDDRRPGEDAAPAGAAAARALTCALAIQDVMGGLAALPTPSGSTVVLGVKVALAAGQARRFLVGYPHIQLIEVLAGAVMDRVAAAEQQAQRGEVVVAAEVAALLGERAPVAAWRSDAQGQRYALLGRLRPPAPVAPWPAEQPIDAEIARAWLLPPVYQRLARGEGDFVAELRRAVPLFIRFNGPDYDHDDEAFAKLDAFVRWAQELLARYEGFLLQVTIGDKGSYCYALFGAPLAHENDTARAVACAIEFSQPPAALSFVRPIQIGVSQGQVYAGAYGAPSRRCYGVLGNEVNIAARLMSAAQPGQILVAGRVAAAARQGYLFQPLGLLALKGQPAPIPAYALQARRASPAELVTHRADQLIGRAAERQVLAERLQALGAGQPGILLIEGEAGIGKSQLVAELAAQAEAAGIGYLIGAGDAIERTSAYHAWRPVFRQLFNITALPDSTPEQRERWLTSVLEQLPTELHSRAPLLDAVLPLDLPDSELTAAMSGEVRASNTNELLLGLLRRRAQHEPLLIILEDVHWFDSASWGLARALADAAFPALLALSARPIAEPWPAGYGAIRHAAHTRRLVLDSLPPAAIDELVSRRLGVAGIPPALAELLRSRAEGNPYFSEQLALALRDIGLIRVQDGSCELAPGVRELRSFDFPDTIQGVITSRVDRLPPAQQLTLKVASVIGRVFPFSTLTDIYPVANDKPALIEHLDRLNRLDITQTEAIEPELAYMFRHILAQEAVYGLLLYAQRQQLHRSVARWYELAQAHDLAPHYPLLAHHWRQAGANDRALDYIEKAGEQALRGGAFVEAAQFFEQALALAAQQAAEPGAPPPEHAALARQAGWRWQLGEACLRLGQLAQGRSESERAMVVFDQPIPTRPAAVAAGIVRELLRQVGHRLRPARVIGAAPAADHARMRTAVTIYQTLSQIYFFYKEQGLSLYAALRQVNIAERAGPSLELAQAYGVICIITGIFGMHRIAHTYYQRALAVAQQMDDPPLVLAHVYQRGSTYFVGAALFDRVRSSLARAIEVYQQLGDRGAWRDCLILLLQAEYSSANYPRTLELVRQIPSAQADTDQALHQFYALQWQAAVALREDRLADTLGFLDTATGFLGRGFEGLVEVSYYGLLAVARLRQGLPAQAEQAAQRALDCIALSRGIPLIVTAIDGYTGAAEVFLALWEAADQAGQPTRQLRAAARRICGYLQRFGWFLPLGQPPAWLYQGRYKWLAGQPAQARRAWQRCIGSAERLAMPYEQACAHFELGRRLPANDPARLAHLSRAQTIFAALGATYDLHLVKEVLDIGARTSADERG